MDENQVAAILFRIVGHVLNPGDTAKFRASLLANVGRYRVEISSVDDPFSVPPRVTEEGKRALIALRSLMATPYGGTWFNATFEIHADGTYHASFDYDNPSEVIIAESVEKEMYVEDLEEFPRSPEAIPAWLQEILDRPDTVWDDDED